MTPLNTYRDSRNEEGKGEEKYIQNSAECAQNRYALDPDVFLRTMCVLQCHNKYGVATLYSAGDHCSLVKPSPLPERPKKLRVSCKNRMMNCMDIKDCFTSGVDEDQTILGLLHSLKEQAELLEAALHPAAGQGENRHQDIKQRELEQGESRH